MLTNLFTKYDALITALVNGAATLLASYLALMAVKNGFKYARSDNPHEKDEALKGLQNMAIGAGIIGLATYIGNQIAGHF